MLPVATVEQNDFQIWKLGLGARLGSRKGRSFSTGGLTRTGDVSRLAYDSRKGGPSVQGVGPALVTLQVNK